MNMRCIRVTDEITRMETDVIREMTFLSLLF